MKPKGGDGGGSGDVDSVSDRSDFNLANMVSNWNWKGISAWKQRVRSRRRPRDFLAEIEGKDMLCCGQKKQEGLIILDVCRGNQ